MGSQPPDPPHAVTPASHRAPAVAVVGPANSGKTTLLHLLDRELQGHPDRPMVYVVKGNPDGTGRYLYEAPALRNALKGRVKGSWRRETVESICRWIDNCRSTLELVLVDFGGRHSPENDRMLERCSHFLVLARPDPKAPEHGDLASWVEVCRRNGLAPVARIESRTEGIPEVRTGTEGALEAIFRGDADAPGDRTNTPVVTALAEALLALRRRRRSPPYLDLHARGRWHPEDLADLGGLAPRLEAVVRGGGPLLLGGAAPAWAYGAALHRALDLDPECLVLQFDPKLAWNLVEIPAALAPNPSSELGWSLAVRWRRHPEGRGLALDVEILTPDRFLPLASALDLARAPVPNEPPEEPPGTPAPLVLYGSLPIWLALTYSRWLRSTFPGRPLAHWDAGTGRAVFVHGPGALKAEPWGL